MALEVHKSGLTDLEARFVAAYMETGVIAEASRLAGYAAPSGAYEAMKRAHVQKALRDAQVRMLECEGGTMAIKTVLELMRPGNPPNVRLGAAGLAGKWAGFGERADAGQQKALTDMNTDELTAFITKLDGVIGDRAEAAVPVVITGVSHVVEGT
jgi:hypothetical protein